MSFLQMYITRIRESQAPHDVESIRLAAQLKALGWEFWA